MEFRKPFEEHTRIYCCSGDPYVVDYEATYDKEGNLILKEIGKTNLYEEIQSHALATDINVIMSKYAAGDTDVLNRVQGYYSDISDIPDLHSLYNMLKSAEQDFTKLPTEIKQQFGNSFEQYLFSVGSEEWMSKMNIIQDIKDTGIDESIVKENDNNGE